MMRSLLVRVCVVVVLVLQCCDGGHGVECLWSDICTCTTDSSFNINVNHPGSAISNEEVSDSQGNKYILSPCAPVAGCGTKNSSKGVITACMWIKEKNENVIIGESEGYEWDVKSEYYFSVTFKSASSATSTPRQAKLTYIVDETVSDPEVKFLVFDEITNTYFFNIRIKSYYSP